MPKFSIIVSVYNIEKYLNQCVDSVLGQSFTDFELILVDDGSPDNCPAVCDEYADKEYGHLLDGSPGEMVVYSDFLVRRLK